MAANDSLSLLQRTVDGAIGLVDTGLMRDLRRLQALVALSRNGSMAAAAVELDCSTQAVSKYLTGLEKEVGVPLVLRHGSRLALTDAGSKLARRAEGIFRSLRDAEQEAHDIHNYSTGTLRVGMPVLPWSDGMSVEALQEATKLTVRVVSLTPEVDFRALLEGDIDILVTYSFDVLPRTIPSNVLVEEIVREPVWIAASSSHTFKQQSPMPLNSLSGEHWIAQNKGTYLHRALLAACRRSGFNPNIVHTGTSWSLKELLQHDLGITLCTPLVGSRNGLEAIPLADPPFRSIMVCYLNRSLKSSALLAREAMRRLYRQQAAAASGSYARWLAANYKEWPS